MADKWYGFDLNLANKALMSGNIQTLASTQIAGGGGSAVVYDTFTSSTYTGATSHSFSHTTSGSNRYLLLQFFIGSGNTVTGVTYNSVAMSSLGSITQPDAGVTIHSYGLPAPATGANTVDVTFSGAPTYVNCTASSYTNVHQTVSTGTVTTLDNGNASSISLDASSATNELVVDAVFWLGTSTTATAGAGQTEIDQEVIGSSYKLGTSYEAGAATTTMSWTFSASAFAAIMDVPLKPA